MIDRMNKSVVKYLLTRPNRDIAAGFFLFPSAAPNLIPFWRKSASLYISTTGIPRRVRFGLVNQKSGVEAGVFSFQPERTLRVNIKAIETIYNGYRFRSRLEARWAVFFDSLGVEYQYEPEGFVLNDGTPYLPDFYLPNQGMWIEIKPYSDESDDSLNKALAFSHHHRICLIYGESSIGKFTAYLFENGLLLGVTLDIDNEDVALSSKFFIFNLTKSILSEDRANRLEQASLAARQARFGKSGRG